jgi:hypothetical protein
MKVRLIKPGASRDKQNKTAQRPGKIEERSEEVQIIDTIRSWVTDFKSRKARGTRLDLRLIRKA